MHHTARLGLGFDEVDALTGPKIGRPKSATYRTADVVGLDTLAHVIGTMDKNLADDPWHRYFKQPEWLAALISKGALGQKSGAGVYRKAGREIQVLDLKAQDYRPSAGKLADEVGAILKERDPAKRFAALRASSHPQAQFLWSLFRDIFHYSAAQLANVADNARDLDLAMRWGFGWAQGPFETWQAAGWQQIAQAVAEDIAAGRAMSDSPCPPGRWSPPARACTRPRVRIRRAAASCMRARPCRCTAARSIPSACSAKRPTTVASPSGKTKACACGTCPTWIRAWPSCRSSPRTTRWAPRCWKASCRPWPAPSASSTAWSSGIRLPSPWAPTCSRWSKPAPPASGTCWKPRSRSSSAPRRPSSTRRSLPSPPCRAWRSAAAASS